jgi:hypothetical protein
MAIDLVQHAMRLNPNSEFNSSPIAWIVTVLLPVLFIWFAISLHVSQPMIRVDKDTFRLETLFYKSKWFTWHDITNIKAVRAPLSSDPVYAIESDQLNALFILAAFNASTDNRAFIIGNDIDELDRLLAYLGYQRPDLFEENDVA